jgi:hypothetical protein
VAARLSACGGVGAGTPESAELAVRTFRRGHATADFRDADVLGEGVSLVVRSAAAGARCGAPQAADRAWRLIGEAHGVGPS